MERHYQQNHSNATYIFKEMNRYADEQQANWQRRIEGKGNDCAVCLEPLPIHPYGWVIKGKFKCCVVAIGYARIVINDQYKGRSWTRSLLIRRQIKKSLKRQRSC